jgi:DNA/RNA-binding domain of Phe-tRNA-synthetase-like protein
MNNGLNMRLDPAIKEKLLMAILYFENVKNHQKNSELWRLIEQQSEMLRSRFSNPGDALKLLKPARDLYRAIGIEPTRTRPSSEALFRRIVKNKELYQISSVVDLCNHASLHFLLPIGLYDVKKISGDVFIRLGNPGEEYEGIGKDVVHVANRLVLCDDRGPFGNPSSDSFRTRVRLDSTEILMVIFAPHHYPVNDLQDHLGYARDILLKYHPGSVLHKSKILGSL